LSPSLGLDEELSDIDPFRLPLVQGITYGPFFVLEQDRAVLRVEPPPHPLVQLTDRHRATVTLVSNESMVHLSQDGSVRSGGVSIAHCGIG
jgi:hypothetical protein